MLKDILSMMRPHQWVKNLFIFPALIFSKNLFNPPYFSRSIAAFCLFCLIAGGIYILNDVMDVEEDRHHPRKRMRPLAAGRISAKAALWLFGTFSAAGLFLAFLLSVKFGLAALVYWLMNVGYSYYLKRVVIVDVMIVALGFVIRAVAGGLVINVEISPWLLVCTILLALFLVLAKRRHELALLDKKESMAMEKEMALEGSEAVVKYRRSLDEYSTYYLDQMIAVSTASTLMAYMLYTMSEDAVAKFGSTRLIYTSPFVIYGIFRYLYLIHQREKGGSPTRALLGDGPLLLDVVLWGVSVVVVLYI